MVIAQKGLGSPLKITREIYKSPITTAFRLRLTTNSNYKCVEFCLYGHHTTT